MARHESKVREYVRKAVGHDLNVKAYGAGHGESFSFVDIYHMISTDSFFAGWSYTEKNLAALTVWEVLGVEHPADAIESLMVEEDAIFGDGWHDYEATRAAENNL